MYTPGTTITVLDSSGPAVPDGMVPVTGLDDGLAATTAAGTGASGRLMSSYRVDSADAEDDGVGEPALSDMPMAAADL